MPAIILGGKTIEASGRTIGELLQQAIEHVEAGHVLSRVVIDGREEKEFQSEAFLKSSAEGVKRVEIESEAIKDLIMRGLAQVREFLHEVHKAIPAVGIGFRQADPGAAKETLVSIGEGLRSLIPLLQGISTLRPQLYASFTFQGAGIQTHLLQFSEVLRAVTEAQIKSDWVRLADVLEYELAPEMERWQDILASIGDALADS